MLFQYFYTFKITQLPLLNYTMSVSHSNIILHQKLHIDHQLDQIDDQLFEDILT